jgi:uncharacterized damage-inducible protein DinB
MSAITLLLKEMDQEAQTTRKMLERIPNDKFQWQPHEKSMNIQQLANHIAELPAWVTMTLTSDELDFAARPYKPIPNRNTHDLLDYFEESLQSGKTHLVHAKEADLDKKWTLRNGDQILNESTKGDMIRMAYSEIVHHRAQLGVYLCLLNIPLPANYDPNANEGGF